MKTLRTAFGLVLAATVGILAAAPATAAERVVPPENSAAHQYTEAFPTARGDKDAHSQRGRDLNPGKVIGAKKTKALSQRGEDGRDVAELTAETAPDPAPAEPVTETTDETATPPAGKGDGGAGKKPADRGTAAAPARVKTVDVAPVEGSSGLSEVLARATGSGSSGGMGIFLPLIIIASIIWALAYATRQRRPVG